MSIYSMATVAVHRRPDYQPEGRGLGTQRDILTARSATDQPTPNTSVTDAPGVITTYIPTETLTLYVVVLAAIAPDKGAASTGTAGQWFAFWTFVVLTPIFVWLVFATKLKGDG